MRLWRLSRPLSITDNTLNEIVGGSTMFIWRSALALCGVVVACVSLQSAASAQHRDWKSVSGWDIIATNDFCMASAIYQNGTFVFLTVHPLLRRLSLTLVHDNWQSLEEGAEYPVEFYFDGVRDPAKMVGAKFDKFRGVRVYLTQTGISRFMNANTMTVLYKREVFAQLSLNGTTAAVQELKNCQLSVNPSGWPSVDNPPDPFRR